MTIKERLIEVWDNDSRMKMPWHDDDATHQWIQQTLEHDWEAAHTKCDATTKRFAFIRSHVRRCKKTKRIIKARLMQALTSSIPYIREFAKLIVKEVQNESR